MWQQEYSHDTAQICLNGHVINESVKLFPHDSKDFCHICGAKTTISCQECRKEIQGVKRESTSGFIFPYDRPSYCIHCGQAYPWTSQMIETALELASLVDEFDKNDVELLSKSIPELMRDTPRRELAILQFKKAMQKTTPHFVEGFKNILYSVLSDPINQRLWG